MFISQVTFKFRIARPCSSIRGSSRGGRGSLHGVLTVSLFHGTRSSSLCSFFSSKCLLPVLLIFIYLFFFFFYFTVLLFYYISPPSSSLPCREINRENNQTVIDNKVAAQYQYVVGVLHRISAASLPFVSLRQNTFERAPKIISRWSSSVIAMHAYGVLTAERLKRAYLSNSPITTAVVCCCMHVCSMASLLLYLYCPQC